MKYNTRLIYIHDPNTGDEGWRVKRMPSMNATGARGLTHDILEHSRNDKGTWHEEISAFGAMVAYRINRADLLYSVEINEEGKLKALAKELAELVSEGWEQKEGLVFKMTSKNPYYPIHPHIQLLADEAAKLIKAPNSFTKHIAEKYLSIWLIIWLKQGHKRATEIIEKSDYEGADLWSVVHDQIEFELFKSNIVFYEGNEVSVQIDFDRCWCTVVPINCKKLFQ
jgi:hypothetical protein